MLRLASLSRESPGQNKFRSLLDAAIRSAAAGGGVDPASIQGMLSLVHGKEVSPGDALSCFKGYFREGPPDQQYQALLVLIQFVGCDPHSANLLHNELASRRWRERFVALAASPHPEIRPLLISTLEGWAASYRAHDIGMHYQATLRELKGAGGSSGGGPFGSGRPAAAGYNAQYTGASHYSTQYTGAGGFNAQATGGGYSPRPGAAPPGYPPLPGYPAYGGHPPPGAMPHPHQHQHHHHPPPRAADSATVSAKLDQLMGEVESLRGCIRTLQGALADYKAQRCSFSALSGALDRGQRSADKCAALQAELENLLGSSDGADEALMGRIFSSNDSAVAALEQWRALANQELAPDDVPALPASSSGAGPSTSAASAAPPPPPPVKPKPAPDPIDLLLGDELPSPVPHPPPPPPQPQQPQQPPLLQTPGAAAAAASAAAFPFHSGAAAANGGAATWPAGPATPSAAAAAPAGHSGTTAAAVVPADSMEGLRSQVVALGAELEQQRRVHATALEAQEAFHRSELAQVKAQAHARISELEAALAAAQQQQQQQHQQPLPPVSFASAPPPSTPSLTPAVSGAAATGPGSNAFGMYGAAYGGLPSSSSFGTASSAPAPAMPYPPITLASTNPFASSFNSLPQPSGPFGPPMGAAASASGMPPMQLPMPPPTAAPPPPPAGTAGAPNPLDILSAFDDLALAPASKRHSAGGAPMQQQQQALRPYPNLPPAPPAAAPAAPAPAAAAAGGPAAGAAGGSWVNFGV